MLELLRHGDTGQTGFRGRLDDALSPLGWVQMEAAVAGRYWQRVLSSPLQRCRRFAESLASRLGVPFGVEPELIEYDFGEWTGRTPAELHAREAEALGRFWADPERYPPPAAEALADFDSRVLAVLQRLTSEFPTQRVLAVTHGGLMRIVECRQRGWPLTRISEIEVPHARLMRVRLDRLNVDARAEA